MLTIFSMRFYSFSGYGSQAVSSTNLSSDDSMSLRSISADDTPETEAVPKEKTLASVATSNGGCNANNPAASDLLSPPDVSLTSISPGEETDTTVTVGKTSSLILYILFYISRINERVMISETTPSSANITPSQSSEWSVTAAAASTSSASASASATSTSSGSGTGSASQAAFHNNNPGGTGSGGSKKTSVTSIHAPPKCHKILREKKNNSVRASQNPNRASYPSAALPTLAENKSLEVKVSSEANLAAAMSTSSISTTSSSTTSAEKLSDGEFVLYLF